MRCRGGMVVEHKAPVCIQYFCCDQRLQPPSELRLVGYYCLRGIPTARRPSHFMLAELSENAGRLVGGRWEVLGGSAF